MLYTYINAIHPLDVRRNGSPLFDGYIVSVAGGAFAGTVPINQCAEKHQTVDDPRKPDPQRGVPVIHIMSESDYLLGIDSRRPDSDKPGDRFRHYEVPGMGHATRTSCTSPRRRRTSSRPSAPFRAWCAATVPAAESQRPRVQRGLPQPQTPGCGATSRREGEADQGGRRRGRA
jgi:hypothetical protein